MISEIEFKQLSLNWASLNSYLISVLTENRPVYVINQLLCPIELRIDEGGLPMSVESAACFYISYLIAFYLEDDLNGAKYLWKRVPQFLKGGDIEQLTDLTNVWYIGKYLFEENVPLAIQYLCTRNWMPNMHPLIQLLHNHLLKLQLNIFATAYSSVRMDYFCQSISKTSEEAEQIVSQRGWSIDASGNVLPKIAAITALLPTNILGDNVRILETITHFAAALEMPSIKVDIINRSKKDQTEQAVEDSKAGPQPASLSSPRGTFAG